MTTTATKTYLVYVIERALAHYKVEAGDARSAAENWQDCEFIGRDDEALDTEGPSSVRERQPDSSWRRLPKSEWESDSAASDPARKPYSVLLLYPDYANDSGSETYYAFVAAPNAIEAVAVAQREALAANDWNEWDDVDADRFRPAARDRRPPPVTFQQLNQPPRKEAHHDEYQLPRKHHTARLAETRNRSASPPRPWPPLPMTASMTIPKWNGTTEAMPNARSATGTAR